MLNHITIMGRLTRDPELRFTQTQKPVATFTLAVDRDYAAKDGGRQQTDFITCVSWNAAADFVSKYFHKGNMAVVSGRLQIREWADKDGTRHHTAEVLTENIYFGERKQEGGSTAAFSRSETGTAKADTFNPADDEGELPF